MADVWGNLCVDCVASICAMGCGSVAGGRGYVKMFR